MPATKKKARQEASGSATRRDDDDDDEDEADAEEDEPLEDDEEDDGDEEDDAEATNDGETSGGGKGKRVATGKMKAAAKLADKREDWTPAEDAIVEEFLRAQEAERVAKAGRKERGEPEPKPPSKKERGGAKLPKKGYARLAEMLKAEGFDRGDSAAQKRAKRLQKRLRRNRSRRGGEDEAVRVGARPAGRIRRQHERRQLDRRGSGTAHGRVHRAPRAGRGVWRGR